MHILEPMQASLSRRPLLLVLRAHLIGLNLCKG